MVKIQREKLALLIQNAISFVRNSYENCQSDFIFLRDIDASNIYLNSNRLHGKINTYIKSLIRYHEY